MALSFQDAAEIAWAAFLDEVGEPLTPDWKAFGWSASCIDPYARSARHAYPFWHIVFYDPVLFPKWDVARVWVDRETGHCNVWVNENYEPPTPEQRQGFQATIDASRRSYRDDQDRPD